MSYDHKKVESFWQKRWEKEHSSRAKTGSKKKKLYLLVEFPYPSGEGMHVGHIRSYTALDVVARKRRAEGYEVLYPIGWDAFGLPAENYAIKTGIHPAIVTKRNTDNFRRQLKSIGISFDWDGEVDTTDPKYYRWTQWIFLELFKKGLAYKAKMPINWCPRCKIGLANEEVVGGNCERCGSPTEKKEKEQWMLAITKYADRLDKDLDSVDYLPQIKTQQRNWIGRSEGHSLELPLKVPGQGEKHKVEIFTTRLDTLAGATFVAASPELAERWLNIGWKASEEVKKYVKEALKQREKEEGAKEKTGVKTDITAKNPLTGEDMPVFVTDYVLGNVGTGAIMAVPAHDDRDLQFALKFNLQIKPVIAEVKSVNEIFPGLTESKIKSARESGFASVGEGLLFNSGEFNGLPSVEAREAITKKLGAKKTTTYKLRDWVFSRQRYWGEPIPMVYCPQDGWVPVSEKDLPVKLPKVEKYQPTDTGESPLSKMEKWVKTKCPKCDGPASRETDVMPNWAGSSWYYLRYTDPKNSKKFADPKALKYWLPVDWYNGGMEHTTLHLLYSRFWHKFLYDRGLVPGKEPYAKRTSHGLVLAEDGSKMSKSKGNVINPDELVEKVGADALRVYEMFMGPFDQAIEWSSDGVLGSRRFLDRVFRLSVRVDVSRKGLRESSDRVLVHQTIKKVSEDIEALHMNTAVSSLMILLNRLEKEEKIFGHDYFVFIKLLSPLAPHLAEELYRKVFKKKTSIHGEPWPKWSAGEVAKKTVRISVQVNGRVRGVVEFPLGATEAEVLKKAKEVEQVSKWLKSGVKKVIYIPDRTLNFVV